MKPDICLLDLNYTLVSNSAEKYSPFSRQIACETYRRDLLEQLQKDFTRIFLLTARPQKYEAETLARIWDQLQWKPDNWFFNYGAIPPVAKQYYLVNKIFPVYGSDPHLYYGVESNPGTRDMYSTHGIVSVPYQVYMEKVTYENTGKLDIQKSGNC